MSSYLAEKIAIQKRPRRRRDRFVDLWLKIPVVFRLLASVTLILTISAIAIGYWSARENRPIQIKGEEAQLSTEVKAVVNGYERRVTSGDKLQMLVKADRETIFADDRHELENVFLEVHPPNSPKPDQITAQKAVYRQDADNPTNFAVGFFGKVHFETRDGLKVETEQISYDKQKETAETAAAVNFSRENVSGSAIGASFKVTEKRLLLHNQVEILIAPSDSAIKNSLNDFGSSTVKINSARANFEQNADSFELEQGVQIIITPQNKQKSETVIRSERAVYAKEAQKLDLSGGVEIVTASDNVGGADNNQNSRKSSPASPATIRSSTATYEQALNQVHFDGEASVEQNNQLIRGKTIVADLNPQKKIQKAVARENAFLHVISGNRTTDVNANEMTFDFDDQQQLKLGTASGNVRVQSAAAETIVNLTQTDSLQLVFQTTKTQSLISKMTASGATNVSLTANNSADYSEVKLQAPSAVETFFTIQNEQSVLKQMQTNGRSTLEMSAPSAQNKNPRATNKRLAADSLKLFWNQSGQSLNRAEAVGRAELYVVPLGTGPDLDKQSLFANRFDADFFETNNLVRTFVATSQAKIVLEPTEPAPQRNVRNFWADKMTSTFERDAQAVERVDAIGNAKFNQVDQNAVANNFVYTASDQMVRLRGGAPTVWDSRARLKATEIDWDTKRDVSFSRGRVSTVYYSQQQTGGAAPFAQTNAPVFVVSNAAEFDHARGTAVYTGDAKAWQDNNYVRAEKLVLQRESGSLFGEGRVQSALYNARRRVNNVETVVPVTATADRIKYFDRDKLLRYESNVDVRQGTERILSQSTEVFLNQKNEVEKTIAETNVSMTQPGRKATGDWVQYATADEVVILRGHPAVVEDAEQGVSSGQQITVYTRENRIVGQGGATENASGRVRSTHKIRKQ